MPNNYKHNIQNANQDFIFPPSKNGQTIPFWKGFNVWDNHHLLPTNESPSISASTTVTNFGSSGSLSSSNNRRTGYLEENLKMTQSEITPLQLIGKEEKIETAINCNSFAVYNDTVTPKPSLFNQILAAISVSLVSLVVGFVTAYTSPASDSLKQDLCISDDKLSWIGGLMPLGALVGGLVGGQMIEYLGRRCTLIVTNAALMVSWICISIAVNQWYLYFGRLIAGVSVGIATLAMSVYLGEVIQPEIRGTLGLLPTAFGNTGVLICFIAGSYLRWRNLAWLGVALPVPFIVLGFLIPETPNWYISKSKYENARKSLQWLRRNSDIEQEFNTLAISLQRSTTPSQSIMLLFELTNIRPLLISLGLMFFQQMSGINAVIFYTSDIFEMAGSQLIHKNTSTIIVGGVNFISTFIATLLIDKLGRKILLYISSIVMVLTLSTLGTYFYFLRDGMDLSSISWLPLVSLMVYVLGFSLGFGAIPWLMMGEILPSRTRGTAASLATAFNWSCTFIVTKTFVDIVQAIGPHGTFWMFSVICGTSLSFIYLWVPETKGQSLEEIEKRMAGLKVGQENS